MVYVAETLVVIQYNVLVVTWVHKKCSDEVIYLQSLLESCNQYSLTGCSSVDIGASANLEFCYLGDVLSVDGDVDAAVEARIRIVWNKFRQLVPLLTNRDKSLIRRERPYSSCVRTSMLRGSETWPNRKKMRWHFSEQR